MGRKKRRRRADRERATERDQDDEAERDAASTVGTPLGMPDAPIPDSPMPDAPMPDAGVPDMGMGGAAIQRHPKSEGQGQASMDGEARERSSLESLYDSLDGSRREALEQIRADDELWASWQSTIESDVIQREIDANGWDVIENALDRYHRNIVQQGHEPVAFMTGDEANEWYLDLNPEDESPHQPACIAISFEPGSEDTLYRITTDGFPIGSFLARKEAFESKKSREDVMNSFSLKEEWGEYNKIATLSLDGSESGQIIISSAAPVTDDSESVVSERDGAIDRQGGVEQYWLTSRLDDDKFKMLDEPYDDLGVFLEEYL
ncbi:hypothetical protein C479_09463 [Halovivax asiaticus JCM 14624]|uniref:Uncharacterized protein n=1 Tax=Halovivax asiaticus JCM 14624 TaxID=1227490 RepID=M0BL63_9EURY|nr:hypothetical protein [Halovivax asiaticus]ELZ11028.1 hypothetical protein C479_09463 [Halovivax asiaticus JCM 14624]